MIGAIWINHHAMFRYIVRADGTLLLLNLLPLMAVAFLPFPTAVLAHAFHAGTDEALATAFYSGTLTLLGLFVTATWWYAARGHRLLGGHVSAAEAQQFGRRYLVGPVLYAIATVIGLVVPWFALLLFIAINVFFLWPRRA